MIPNRIFVALLGAAFIGLAVHAALATPVHLGAVLFPALGGLWLINIAIRVGRHGHHGMRHGMCGGHGHHRGPVGTEGGEAK